MLTPHQGFTYNKFEKPNDWPKLKDTFDYQYDENGYLVGGNEHLYLSGPVNYTKVGTPTIVDGVVSGFSASNYLKTGDLSSDTAEVELFALCTPASTDIASGIHPAFGFINYGTSNSFVGVANSGRPWCTLKGIGGTTYDFNKTTIILQADVPVYLKLAVKNNVGTFSYSLNNFTWTEIKSVDMSADPVKFLQGNNFRIGHSAIANNIFNGSIDINETYIKINNGLWFYGKNYTTKYMTPVPAGLEYNNTTTQEIGWVYTSNELVKGPVNYTKVGNPKIVDGVVSGFSENDYARTSAIITSSTMQSIEVCCKFTIGTISEQGILGSAYQFSKYGFNLNSNGTLRTGVRVNAGGTETNKNLTSTMVLDANSTYYAVMSCDKSTHILTLKISTDNENWTTYTSDIGAFDSFVSLGYSIIGYTQNGAFLGSIDLNETYIKVNGQAWFGSVSKFQEFISAPQGTMIGKDDTHSLVVETYQDKGIVDYTVVGTPTIVDGVASGFSDNYYLTVGTNLPSSKMIDYELYSKFTIADSSSAQSVLGFYGSAHNLGLVVSSAKKIIYYIGYVSGLQKTITSTNSFQNGDTVIAHAYYAGNNTFVLKTSNDNGVTWDTNTLTLDPTTLDNLNTTNPIRLGRARLDNYAWPFLGSIDLNETYIKVNGQAWFHPYPNSYPKLVGPVNYTTVGSPTISNGVVSGFSSSDYLSVASNTSCTSVTVLELFTKATIPAVDTNNQYVLSYRSQTSNGFLFSPQGKIKWVIARVDGTTSDFEIPSSISVSQGDTVLIHGYYEGNNVFVLRVSKDNGATWTTNKVTHDLSTLQTPVNDGFRIGDVRTNYDRHFNGSIDLNNTYIKVNGSLWFGKEDWTPSTYTDNAIYLLSGHKSDYSQYNELGINPIIETDSDELGSYNVWIDNQKIRSNMSQGTHIDWSKLALTTGYSITTPSSLKAHTIKIEPANDSDKIIGFHSFEEDSDESI